MDASAMVVVMDAVPEQPNLAKRHRTPIMLCPASDAFPAQPEASQQHLWSSEAFQESVAPISLDDVLAKRNTELLHSMANQLEVFLSSVREVILHQTAVPQTPRVTSKTSSRFGTLSKDLPDPDLDDVLPTDNSEPSSPGGVDKDTTNVRQGGARSVGETMADMPPPVTIHDLMRDHGFHTSEDNVEYGNKTATCLKTRTRSAKRPSNYSGYSETSSDGYTEAIMVAEMKRKSVEGAHTEDSDAAGNHPRCHCSVRSLSSSVWFQSFFTGAIITNTLLIGVQTEYTAVHLGDDPPKVFFILSSIYSFLFLAELVVQVTAHGFKLFYSATWYWSWLDLFLVVTSMVDFVSHLLMTNVDAGASTSQLRVMRVFRVARLARLVRIMRVVKALRALRTLCYSIWCTLKSLMWALVLIGLIIYIFGILLTDTASTHLLDNPPPWNEGSVEFTLDEYFGTLHRSVNSLFQSICGGLDWRYAAVALSEISWIWAYCFTTYIAFTCFAVLNVMTGVFCQSALESAQRDADLAIQNVLLNRQRFEGMLMTLFKQIDEDGSGRITITEFENHFQDEAFKCLLHSLELEVSDAWSLFVMLDLDGDHGVDATEFLDGCMHLKGSAKAIEVAKLKRKTEQCFVQMRARLSSMERAQDESTSVLRQVANMISERSSVDLEFGM